LPRHSEHYSGLAHTPFDGSQPLFKIGLQPFASHEWLHFDDNLDFYLQEKKQLHTEMPERVFQAQDHTQDAQREVLDLITAHLSLQGIAFEISDMSLPPLLQAAHLVQEDLVIMRKSSEGWRLVAGSVCFPSSWSLQEKIGKAMHTVHAPVPGFNEGTRNAAMVERIFDNLQVELPAERFNWSVYNDDALFHDDRSGEHMNQQSDCYLRVERQTLTKLPKTGDILFTIRIYVDPFEALEGREDRAAIANGFIELLHMMKPEQLAYKGLDEGRDSLIGKLQKLADTA